MDFISDNFISYCEPIAVKQEKLTDADPSFPSSMSDDSESTSPCTGSVPLTLQNFLNFTDPLSTGNNDHEKQVISKKHKPFRIIKSKPGEPAESINLKFENDDKVLSRTKRIMKRVKAKQRIQLKLEAGTSGSPTGSKCAQDLLNDSNLDDKSKKKMVQMIRNRISAQNSRDRKKCYMTNLEQSKNKLSEDNSRLRLENSELLKEIRRLQQTQTQLSNQNKLIKKGFKFMHDSGNEESNKSLIGNEGHILLAKHFGKDFEEVSSMVMSKFPNCDKSLFNSVFSFATFLSMTIMTDYNQTGSFPSQGVGSLGDAEKMLSQVIGDIGNFSSGEQREEESSSLITCLNDFPSKNDHSANYKAFFESHLHAGRTLSQGSEIIKIEESDNGAAGFYNNPMEADLVAKDHAFQNLSEEPTFNLLSPRNFKALDEKDSKILNSNNHFEDLGNFQDDQAVDLLQPSAFAGLSELTNIEVSQSDKEKNDTGLMGLLLKALMNPDLLQKTSK